MHRKSDLKKKKKQNTTSVQELVGFAEAPNPVSHAQLSAELTPEGSKAFKLPLLKSWAEKHQVSTQHRAIPQEKQQLGE